MTLHTPPHHNNHKPVLLKEVLHVLNPNRGDSYLDLTGGYGGHSSAVLSCTNEPSKMVLVDRDDNAIAVLKETFKGQAVEIIKNDFRQAAIELSESNRKFDMILIDLGVSSPQLDNADRGFSFQKDGPLDMRMDQDGKLDAAELVNNASLEELSDLLLRYGQEPRARRIAKAIINARPLSTTLQLAGVVQQTIGQGYKSKKGKHPATRTFQALRIAVNDELAQVADTLPILPGLLNPGGRLAIISFHSLEDRLVKEYLKDNSEGYEAILDLVTKKPISGTEDVYNPRARSAMLRAAVKK